MKPLEVFLGELSSCRAFFGELLADEGIAGHEHPSNINAISCAEHVTRAITNVSYPRDGWEKSGNTRFLEYRDDNRARHTKQTKNPSK